MKKLALLALAVAVFTACDEGTGLNGTRVGVEFALPPSVSPSASVAPSAIGSGGAVARSIDVSGDNGVLTLDTVHVILSEFEMDHVDGGSEGEDGEHCDSMTMGTPCEEFEAPPSLVELPLDGGSVTAVSAEIPEGQYGGVEFEVENLDDSEEDDVESQHLQELRDSILAEFGEWPQEASMRIVGSFTPTDGDPIPFVAFVDAEIEVELHFDTPFVVTADDVTRTVTVELDPADWFKLADGTVIDLSGFDWSTTHQVMTGFEQEIEDGFHGVEHDDD